MLDALETSQGRISGSLASSGCNKSNSLEGSIGYFLGFDGILGILVTGSDTGEVLGKGSSMGTSEAYVPSSM